MQVVTKTTLFAVLAMFGVVELVATFMLIDTAVAVEVTGGNAPLLPRPQQFEQGTIHPTPDVDPPSPDSFILGSRSFTIPFSVDSSGAAPVEVHLYFSRGRTGSWKLLSRKSPDSADKHFQFTADQDGEYWFATRTMDSRGRAHPSGDIESQLKVYIDTKKPQVALQAEADPDGRIDAVLEITDATPLKNIQLRYVTDISNQWKPVDVGGLPDDGKLQFTPPKGWTQLSLQLVASDTPGNRSVESRLIRRPRLAAAPEDRYATAPGGSLEAHPAPFRMNASDETDALVVANPVIQLDRNNPTPRPNLMRAHGYIPGAPTSSALDGFRGAGPIGATAPAPSLVPAPGSVRSPGFVRSNGPSSAATNSPPTNRPTPSPPLVHNAQRTSPAAPAAPGLFDRLFQLPPNGAMNQPPAMGPSSMQASPAGTAAAAQSGLPDPATADQISNGFGLNSPSQIRPETQARPETNGADKREPVPPRRPNSAAEALRPLSEKSAVPNRDPEEIPSPRGETSDDVSDAKDRYRSMRSAEDMTAGRAPVRYSDSERFSLDYELEAVGTQGVDAIELYGTVNGGRSWDLWGSDPDVRSPFDIETKEAGVFGFRIVVISRNGLASPRPLSGESPDIVVVVDKTQPKVRISGARYGEGNRIGSLVIQYECDDANLTQRPIALSFSDKVDGPWTTIAAGLRNDGDYVWPADPQLPRQLYLRIDATDHAGNVGTYILDQPIDAQGLAPRARIRGFQPLTGGELPVSDGQTAQRPEAAFK